MSPAKARLVRSEVPRKRTAANNMWTSLVDNEMLRAMRLAPGVTFLVSTPRGDPMPLALADANALRASCPEPFRFQSRAATADSNGPRHVWLSFDPAHWEERKK